MNGQLKGVTHPNPVPASSTEALQGDICLNTDKRGHALIICLSGTSLQTDHARSEIKFGEPVNPLHQTWRVH
ncbi:hypothetical protein SBA4_5440025 [Candidatus Sulfopaludibacter sp. SbA4]|nr:hypothetical protein SBA4_5440025 [Candidatus Sulfopaludibacter sp. SbA4]